MYLVLCEVFLYGVNVYAFIQMVLLIIKNVCQWEWGF